MASPWSNARSAWRSSMACCPSSGPWPTWRTRTSWSRRPSDTRCCAGSARAFSRRSTSGRTRRTIRCSPPSSFSGRWIGTAPRVLPKRPPSSFLPPQWRKLIFANGAADRRFYETAVLATLRERLRGSNIWVPGSRDYRAFEDYLLPARTGREPGSTVRPIPVVTSPAARRRVHERLTFVAACAARSELDGVEIEEGKLYIARTTPAVPEAARPLAARLKACCRGYGSRRS